MTEDREGWVPTARIRWLRTGDEPHSGAVLQQWFAPDVPGYMRRQVDGEWREIPCEVALP